MNDKTHKAGMNLMIDTSEKHPGIKFGHLGISGSHLFGWASETSDVDVRGWYVQKTDNFLTLDEPKMTIENSQFLDGLLKAEIQCHEIKKYLSLLCSGNMNIIEETLVPETHKVCKDYPHTCVEVDRIARQAITKLSYPHIQGLITHMTKHSNKYKQMDPKTHLYIHRELMRGIILFERGDFLSNIKTMTEHFDSTVQDEVNVLLFAKKEHSILNEMGVKNALDTTNYLEGRMVIAKEYGVLRKEPIENLRTEANRLLLKVRKGQIE